MKNNPHIKFLNAMGVDPKKIKLCIETGTYRGWGVKNWALFFDKVITIELSEDLVNYCKKTYDFKNVEFLCGSSNEILKHVVDKVTCPYFIFLDAHGSGGDTVHDLNIGRYGSPVIKEIQSLKENLPEIIAIDDASDFDDLSTYPSKEEIIKEVANIGEYTFSLYKEDIWQQKGIFVFKLNK